VCFKKESDKEGGKTKKSKSRIKKQNKTVNIIINKANHDEVAIKEQSGLN
jgi:hypothetical protein